MTNAGQAAGALSAVLGLLALVLFNPIKRRVKAARDAKKAEREDEKLFRGELRGTLAEIKGTLDGLSEDIGDLQYERLSQAQDFYLAQGWCPGAKKEMLCKMHASYRARGRNHLSEHYEEEILKLPDRPAKKEA